MRFERFDLRGSEEVQERFGRGLGEVWERFVIGKMTFGDLIRQIDPYEAKGKYSVQKSKSRNKNSLKPFSELKIRYKLSSIRNYGGGIVCREGNT